MKKIIGLLLFLSSPCLAGVSVSGGGGAAKTLEAISKHELSVSESVVIDEIAFKELTETRFSKTEARKLPLSIKSIDFETKEVVLRRNDGKLLHAQQHLEEVDLQIESEILSVSELPWLD